MARFSYIRFSARLTTACSFAVSPPLATPSRLLAIGIRLSTCARPFGDSATTTSRFEVFERVRVTSPCRTIRVTSRDMVEASIEVIDDEVDLPLLAVVGQRRQHAPHVEGEALRRERVPGIGRRDRGADAIDEVRQVVVEVEMRALGHGFIPGARIVAGRLRQQD